ncbi:MAG: hypothetical protein AAF985_05375 [Bacteroidota bacterium]
MKKSNKLLLEIIVGIFIGFLVLWKVTQRQVDFENLALGKETKTYFAQKDGAPIHLKTMDTPEWKQMKAGWKQRGSKEVILVLGNSQTHSINQLKPGEVTYNELLFTDFQEEYDVLTLTYPNAGLQEFFLTISYALNQYPIKAITVPIFMDDMRENGIRTTAFTDLAEQGYRLQDTTLIALKINQALSKLNTSNDTDDDLQALRETPQEKTEKYLSDQLSAQAMMWKERPKVRGELFISLYRLRNSILGINAQTKRKMIPSYYRDNLEALEGLLRLGEHANVVTFCYIPPIRQDVEVPYDLSEYNNFKKDIAQLTQQYPNTYFSNLEAIIPAEYWGVKKSTNISGKAELDFMHFQYQGHELLYSKLKEELTQLPL